MEKEIASSKKENESNIYTYDEAVSLTGYGLHSIVLLIASCFAMIGLNLDLFSLPVVGSIAACDLQLDSTRQKILFSMPFSGVVIAAYPWGYISDTRGRRAAMLTATWVSFAASFFAAFSPHWVIMLILKIVSTSCSSCTLSMAFTLVGESCGKKVKTLYFYIITSFLHFGFPIQMALHYISLSLHFSIGLGYISFVPWRLLAIMLALPLAFSAICLHFVYESPKYLANAGKESEAVVTLAKIWKRNGQPGDVYPVERIVLNEDNINLRSDTTLLQSLWQQVIPLFRMPLVFRTVQLYYLLAVTYISCGGLLAWFPFLTDAFISGTQYNQSKVEGICNIISQYPDNNDTTDHDISCDPKSDLTVVWASFVQTAFLTVIICSVSLLGRWRKLVTIFGFLVSGLAALACAVVENNALTVVAYFSIFLTIVTVAPLMSYFVEIFPTSHRGMVTCLSMMIGRLANLFSVNLIGTLYRDHCHTTYYTVAAVFLSGIIVACFLPPDKIKTLK